jgi:hypothetical protein
MLDNQFAAQQGIRTNGPGHPIVELIKTIRSQGDAVAASGVGVWKDQVRFMTLASFTELAEFLESTPWKPWRSAHATGSMTPEQLQEAKLEIVDLMCFLTTLWMLIGGTGDEMGLLHAAKCQENLNRQKAGY